jgi:hypothetical protein
MLPLVKSVKLIDSNPRIEDSLSPAKAVKKLHKPRVAHCLDFARWFDAGRLKFAVFHIHQSDLL